MKKLYLFWLITIFVLGASPLIGMQKVFKASKKAYMGRGAIPIEAPVNTYSRELIEKKNKLWNSHRLYAERFIGDDDKVYQKEVGSNGKDRIVPVVLDKEGGLVGETPGWINYIKRKVGWGPQQIAVFSGGTGYFKGKIAQAGKDLAKRGYSTRADNNAFRNTKDSPLFEQDVYEVLKNSPMGFKKAYHMFMKTHHPDVKIYPPDFAERISQDLNSAYEALKKGGGNPFEARKRNNQYSQSQQSDTNQKKNETPINDLGLPKNEVIKMQDGTKIVLHEWVLNELRNLNIDPELLKKRRESLMAMKIDKKESFSNSFKHTIAGELGEIIRISFSQDPKSTIHFLHISHGTERSATFSFGDFERDFDSTNLYLSKKFFVLPTEQDPNVGYGEFRWNQRDVFFGWPTIYRDYGFSAQLYNHLLLEYLTGTSDLFPEYLAYLEYLKKGGRKELYSMIKDYEQRKGLWISHRTLLAVAAGIGLTIYASKKLLEKNSFEITLADGASIIVNTTYLYTDGQTQGEDEEAYAIQVTKQTKLLKSSRLPMAKMDYAKAAEVIVSHLSALKDEKNIAIKELDPKFAAMLIKQVLQDTKITLKSGSYDAENNQFLEDHAGIALLYCQEFNHYLIGRSSLFLPIVKYLQELERDEKLLTECIEKIRQYKKN